MIAFFTAPATGSLLWCIALLIVTVALLVYTEMATRPPRLSASTTSAELGAETPALASLVTNGFVVTPPAAVATLLDLVARGWLRVEQAEHEVVLLTDRRGRAGDALTAYEQQVLNHVHRLTHGTLTGVSGAGVEIAGLRLSRRWWRRFTKAVVTDARRQGLTNVAGVPSPSGRRSSRSCCRPSCGGARCAPATRRPSSTRCAHGASPLPWPSPSSSSAGAS